MQMVESYYQHMINDIKKLSQLLRLNLAIAKERERDMADFPLLISKSFISRIKQGDINDPLLLQILPQLHELKESLDFVIDPLAKQEYSPLQGLIHKYRDRILLLASDACAIHCRFCFRRHLNKKILDWQKVFIYIKQHPTISEVILSGGDPLMLTTDELTAIIKGLEKIPHIKRVRIHSRVPIVMPEKVINTTLPQTHLPIILVVHSNHPNEIDDNVAHAINRLRLSGITLFNQSVLLRGINNNASILTSLSEKLFNVGIIPYYLHMLDKVKGTTHFYIDSDEAKQIHLEMQNKLPGYLVPKLVIELQSKKTYV